MCAYKTKGCRVLAAAQKNECELDPSNLSVTLSSGWSQPLSVTWGATEEEG